MIKQNTVLEKLYSTLYRAFGKGPIASTISVDNSEVSNDNPLPINNIYVSTTTNLINTSNITAGTNYYPNSNGEI